MLDFTFLTKEQCFDENRKLDFFNKRDCIAENTDFTSLLSQNISFPYYSKGNASWWLQTADANQKVPYIVLADGTYKSENMYSRKFGARPAVSYSSIKDIATDKRVTIDRVISVSFGEYPQNLASDFYKEILEQQYEDGSIKELHCTYDPKTKNGTGFNERKPNGTIHFVDASTALPATFNLFEPLILDSVVSSENFKERLNPNSWVVKEGFVESWLENTKPMDKYQFVRNGYFTTDYEAKGNKLIFNRIVNLKSSFNK